MSDAIRTLQHMAELQDLHNCEVDPNWREAGFAYYRAVWVECAELLDHFGWKWWKHQSADLEQVRLEVVDIWHFGLSQLLIENRVDGVLAERMAAPMQADVDLRAAVEALALDSLSSHSFDPDRFKAVMDALAMSFADLARIYLGKNVLNRFRQRHGYKSGRYRKLWDGREDNQHLVELVADLQPGDAGFEAALYAALEARYGGTEQAAS